jgi:hypothetical protein
LIVLLKSDPTLSGKNRGMASVVPLPDRSMRRIEGDVGKPTMVMAHIRHSDAAPGRGGCDEPMPWAKKRAAGAIPAARILSALRGV